MPFVVSFVLGSAVLCWVQVIPEQLRREIIQIQQSKREVERSTRRVEEMIEQTIRDMEEVVKAAKSANVDPAMIARMEARVAAQKARSKSAKEIPPLPKK